jgi:AraC family transcriptional regulator
MYASASSAIDDLELSSSQFEAGSTTLQCYADLPRKRRRTLDARALDRVGRYVKQNIAEAISLDDLASAACISRFHFARLFRASTGDSPMEYVRKVRISLAMEMLVRERHPVAVTAANLGFFDQSHFTRTFRRLIGVPPKLFAKRQNAEACAMGA